MRPQAHPVPVLGPLLSPDLPRLSPSGPASCSAPLMGPLTVNFTAASATGLGLAVGARGAPEGLAVNGSCGAGTASRAANGDPGLTLLEKPRGEPGSEGGRASSPSSRPVSLGPRSECLCWPRLEAVTGRSHPDVSVPPPRGITFGVLHTLFRTYPSYR